MFEKNPALGRTVLGPEVILDGFQHIVLSQFYELRNSTPSDQGIVVPRDEDPVIRRHLRAMDGAYRDERRKAVEAEIEKARSHGK